MWTNLMIIISKEDLKNVSKIHQKLLVENRILQPYVQKGFNFMRFRKIPNFWQ